MNMTNTALSTAASSLRTELRFWGTSSIPAGLAPRGSGYGLEQTGGRTTICPGLPLIKRVVTGEFTS
jgi:hypothetical protein